MNIHDKITRVRSVLIISMYFRPEISGESTLAWNRAMIFHKIGFSVFVLCGFPSFPMGKVSDSKYKGKLFYVEKLEPFIVIRLRLIPITHTGLTNRFILFLNFIFITLLFMPQILKITGTIGITYARSPILFSAFIGFIYAKCTRSFFILEMPDLWPEELVHAKPSLSFTIMPVGKALAKLAYKLPHIIVTLSDLAINLISKKYHPKKPVYCLFAGVDTSEFPIRIKNNSRMELIKRQIFPSEFNNKFIVLHLGSIAKMQQLENLAYAAEKLKSENEIVIVIIGEGEEKHILKQLKTEMELENCYLLPSKPRDLIPVIISSVDVCTIMLSPEPIFQIVMPIKFYEYLASKKPMIGVCEGELAKIINSNGIGRTVTSANVAKLASDIKDFKNSPTMLQIMENNCVAVLKKFSLEKISSDLDQILKKECGYNS